MINIQAAIDQEAQNLPKNSNRTELLADIPVTERRLKLNGISTAVLEGGKALRLFCFMIWPTEKNFNRFFPHCMYDVDDLRNSMGRYWKPFIDYNLECANDKNRNGAMQLLMKTLGIPRIPEDDLKKIDPPTVLIWGRHDKANKLKIAEAASERYGWPLHIIEEARDDPKLERPEAFVHALNTVLCTVNIH